MSIALDAMGGDNAPGEIVAGALEAAAILHTKIYLVGSLTEMQPHLPATLPKNIEIVPASESVSMGEKPLEAYKRKKDSSLLVAAQLVKDGKAVAMVSAGNTGAATAFAQLVWRPIKGIDRPAIAASLPNRHGGFLLLDSGASPDVDPKNLVEFALMGRAYAKTVMGRPDPRVHLLNIGEEPGKGNAFAKEAFNLLSKHEWFSGNIEGKDVYREPCDVVVCDAFVGNVMLKASEGVAEMISSFIREQVPTNPATRLLYWPLLKVRKAMRKEFNYDESGGAPLLGLNGLCIICHGRSNAKAIRNALKMAEKAIDNGLVSSIKETICINE